MWELAMRKAECQTIDAYELWCWRKFWRLPWTARRSNQSMLKEISPEYSLEDWCWSSNTLATWCKESTHWKRPWCWERLQAEEKGMTEDEMVGWHHQLNRHESEQAPRRWWRTGKPAELQSIASQRVRHDWVTEQQQQRWAKKANYRIYTVWIGYL